MSDERVKVIWASRRRSPRLFCAASIEHIKRIPYKSMVFRQPIVVVVSLFVGHGKRCRAASVSRVIICRDDNNVVQCGKAVIWSMGGSESGCEDCFLASVLD